MKRPLSLSWRAGALLLAALVTPAAHASGLGSVRFVIVDPITGKPTTGYVRVETDSGQTVLSSNGSETDAVETSGLKPTDRFGATPITISLGASVVLVQRDQVPTKDITIRVTATRLMPNKAPGGGASTVRSKDDIAKFTSPGQQDAKALTKGQAGVAEDSAGQAHVRGEHGDISYVVDGVPLPDTLSGRQGSVVVSSTIQSLEIITGGFAPEFGGLTAAVLNVTTLSSVAKAKTEYSLLGGSYDNYAGDLTSVGPLGSKSSYVIDLNASRTRAFQEPQQPGDDDAHNKAATQSAFLRFRFTPSSKDAFSFTLSGNPADIDIPNRTGLPAKFQSVGQGYGLFGQRNADGTRPDATPGTLGSETILLPSQQKAGQDIVEKDITEFSTLAYTRHLRPGSDAQLALTLLHSGQDVTNDNPQVSLSGLPVDSSIEFSPEAFRNVHHVQLNGSLNATWGKHKPKIGFLYDDQSGVESYRLAPGSQLALNALAVMAPALAPAGTASSELDVNGNPVFTATGDVPTVVIQRKGYYAATYLQDTWTFGRLVSNYGLRGDWYHQELNGGEAKTDSFTLSPRLNFSYDLNRRTQLHLAYNHLMNTPPIAQGALLGQIIEPEIFDQYDASLSRSLGRGQKVSLGYYYKQIEHQFDTGLLIPGSQIGIYNTVSLDKSGVHGVEFSYDIAAPGGVGWDGYFNYSYSAAKPKGFDNTGEPVDPYVDHDQRQTIGAGLAYTLKSGASAALTYQLGSGLASSVVPPSEDRTPRDQFDLKLFSGNRLFGGKAGMTLDVQNLFDTREVINFQSAFSGTRFQMGRRISLSLTGKF